MRILEFYNGNKTYMFPNMKIATPEVMLAEFPAILTFKHVIETDENGEVCFAVENFSAMRTRHGIDKTLSDEDALSAIQDLMNVEPEEPMATPEERIASALEFQTMMLLPDEEV